MAKVEGFSNLLERAQSGQRKIEAAKAEAGADLEKDVEAARAKIGTSLTEHTAKLESDAAKVGSAWTNIQANWTAHLDKIKASVRDKEQKLDSKLAAKEADAAEVDAELAVDFALSAIDQAEAAVVYSIFARKYADDLG
ncbi:hypothetical protein P3F83_01795 [Mycobacteroides immunogenum]|uniref:hypothetical protein n=1 Tax=Mycobacteroides immunogenum TaxID=83262 RepID=UPI0025B7382F|nr:hypothetical protein [Mycobacteroides immunogenum]WJR34206.1 hypothetical protein P3F83_01795 [Mycobacteroides immunogenum]